MKFSLSVLAFFLPSAAHATRSMLRKQGRDDESPFLQPASLYQTKSRELSHESDIESGTPVVDLCDHYPEYGVFDALPVALSFRQQPDKVFKIENSVNMTFTFSTCGTTSADTTISIWDGFEKGEANYLAYDKDTCSSQSMLTWTAPNNSVYYVKFGGYGRATYSTNAIWSVNANWEYCFRPRYCGPSIYYPLTGTCDASQHLQCCDDTTGAIGPNCCGSIPYDASKSTCCGDGSIVAGVDDASLCSPSSQPTSAPTNKPSSFPSSQPSRLTCEMVNPCDYDVEDDGTGGIDIIETYFPVCIHEETSKKSHYHQKCYPESIIAGLGAGDVDPEHDDRMIVNCGCCASDDMLPADIDKVTGSTDVCDRGLDCLAEGASVSISKSGKKSYFQMCIDGDDNNWEMNFYVPDDDETASCGQCDDGDSIIV